eukprot:COSAG01_NODE_5502_length_4220_cov_2.482893_4_plen_71_part_00
MAYRGLVLAASVGGLMVAFQTLPDGFFGAAAATARHPPASSPCQGTLPIGHRLSQARPPASELLLRRQAT